MERSFVYEVLRSRARAGLCCVLLTLYVAWSCPVARARQTAREQTAAPGFRLPPKFPLPTSGLELERPSRAGAFYDVAGRRAAGFGYEHRQLEAWVYPLKLVDQFELSFQLEGYPLPFSGADTLARVTTRPEATVFTYSHAAFTVRQIVFAPVDEPGLVMLLDVDSALPLTVGVSFRPRLRLSWPAGLMTGSLSWDEKRRAYHLGEETNRFVGVVGSPLARDVSVMPYQEEPRDAPARFLIEATPEQLRGSYIPIVIAGASAATPPPPPEIVRPIDATAAGRSQQTPRGPAPRPPPTALLAARQTYERLLSSVESLYEWNVAHYRRLLDETLSIDTPDDRLDQAFAWAKVGVDKGVVTNPLLGTGLVAGYRTSGESERPGFAWFFGRDALWTAFALNSCGDFATTRAALDFLKKFQRADGKIPHEISQSASLIPWFTDYEYPWASADATPLYVIAHADLWRAGGDTDFLRQSWPSILKAYRFTEATDTDANGLVENTRFGHGWVEGGALYPPHEEIYLQGLWIAASRDLAEMCDVVGDKESAARARANAERTRAATEKIYWLPARGFYAYATKRPATEPPKAEPGPNRARRQARMDELARATLYDEDTVLPSVPLWFRVMTNDERAQSQIDHLGGAAIATDWGARIISAESRLYDPLSYHHGSVWPLFTGWASLAAYNYGRPHVGYQLLIANALLTFPGAQGFVTELLSGDFNAPFGRSSHHQIWSEAMVITPAVRGLLGVEAGDGGRELRIAPQLPADWGGLSVRNIPAGGTRFNLQLTHDYEATVISVSRVGARQEDAKGVKVERLIVAPALPPDANVSAVTVNARPAAFKLTRMGDVQRVEVALPAPAQQAEIRIEHSAGTRVWWRVAPAQRGARNSGLRLIRVRVEGDVLRLVWEGLGETTYGFEMWSDRWAGDAKDASVRPQPYGLSRLFVKADGPPDRYGRRETTIPLRGKTQP